MITEAEFAEAVDSRSDRPIYELMKKASVGIAGCGGLGSNIAAALARSGVGHIVIADHDTVELSNINRQIYSLSSVGKTKVSALSEIISQIDPFCRVTAHNVRITAENCAEIFEGCDIIIEALDLPDQKAMFVNAVMEQLPEKHLISGNGMAGYGRANAIVTRYVTDRLTICGDGTTDIAAGSGLTACRVMICAGHMASRAAEIILGQ